MTKTKNKMKNTKYHTFGTIPKSNKKIIIRGKIDTLDTKYMTAPFLGTGT
jgi:hypothetical protein